MSGLSVQLNNLNIGPYRLDSQKISPLHRRRAETSLSNYFSNHNITLGGQKVPFQLKFDTLGTILQLGDRKISLEKNKDLKELNRVIKYYQHMGLIPRPGMDPHEALRYQGMSKEAVEALEAASVPGVNGKVLAGMRITEDTLSLTRNILFAIPTIGPDDPVVNHLGYYAGVFWTFFAFKELDNGVQENKRSSTIGDREGQNRAIARILSGGIVTTASMAYLVGKVLDTFEVASTALTTAEVANAFFGVGSLLAMGVSALSAYRCYRFNERLNEYLENPHLPEAQKLKGALRFLKDSITATPEERAEMVNQIEKDHPHWTPKQKAALLEQKIKDLAETKVKYLKRRTSNKSLRLIITQVDKLLAKLSNENTVAEGIKEATILLHTLQQENKTKMAIYILGFVAALISFIAMVIGTFFTAGALPFVLYGIAGTIYLVLSGYNISNVITKKDPDAKLDLHPVQDLGPH